MRCEVEEGHLEKLGVVGMILLSSVDLVVLVGLSVIERCSKGEDGESESGEEGGAHVDGED